MDVEVTRLRRRGLQLNPDELDPPMRGDLIVKVNRDGVDGLVVREASLIVYTGLSGTPRSILPRLSDARMVEIEGLTLTLIGVEHDHATNGRGPEHVQVWRCTLLTGLGPPSGKRLPRSPG